MTEETSLEFDKRLSYAWLAGLIDGEGWFGMSRHTYSLSNSKLILEYQPGVSVNMTDESTIDKICQITGYHKKYLKCNPNVKLQFLWKVSRMHEARTVLEMIRPYCHTKRPQIETLIEWIDGRRFKKSGRIQRGEIDCAYDERYYISLKALNLRGGCTLMQNQTNSTGRDQKPTCL